MVSPNIYPISAWASGQTDGKMPAQKYIYIQKIV
jgi:hypothetical protein